MGAKIDIETLSKVYIHSGCLKYLSVLFKLDKDRDVVCLNKIRIHVQLPNEAFWNFENFACFSHLGRHCQPELQQS